LKCVVKFCRVLQSVASRCSVVQYVADAVIVCYSLYVCCSVLQGGAECNTV